MSKFQETATALKIASRSMKRNRLQSSLIIAIIAVPVMLVSALLTFDASTTSTPSEQIKYQLGDSQALYEVQQSPSKNLAQMPASLQIQEIVQEGMIHRDNLVDLTTVLPIKSLISISRTEETFKTKSGIGSISVFVGESWNEKFLDKGPVTLVGGSTPKRPGEVMVTPSALKRFGVNIGDHIYSELGQKLTVVGTLRDNSTTSSTDIVFVQEGDAEAGITPSTKYFYQLDGQSPSWAEVLKLNQQGVAVLSRQVLLNPPSADELPIQNGSSVPFVALFSVLLFLVPLGMLPVIVLAGSAFAFGARRQTRTLAVMASLGANRKTLQNLTLTSGLWLGFLGGSVGAILGVLTVAFFGPAMATRSFQIQPAWITYPGFHVPWLLLGLVVVGSSILGAISSYLPARRASRVNILATLRGQRLEGHVRARSGVGALIMLLIGIAVVFLSVSLFLYAHALPTKEMADYETRQALMQIAVYGQLFGGILTVIGFIVGRGWILRGIRTALSPLGKRANFAGRDLLFNRTRYAPVLSSVLVVYFVGALILSVSFGPMQKQALQMQSVQSYLPGQYQYDFPNYFGEEKSVTAAEIMAGFVTAKEANYKEKIMKDSAAFTGVSVINATADLYGSGYSRDLDGNMKAEFDISMPHVLFNPESICYYQPLSSHYVSFTNTHKDSQSGDYLNYPSGCVNLMEPSRTLVVGDVKMLRVIANRTDAKAEETLQSGGVVVFSKLYDFNGTAKVRWLKESEYSRENNYSSQNASRSVDLESYLVPGLSSPNYRYAAMISQETAASLGIEAAPIAVLANSVQPPSNEVLDLLRGKGIYLNSYADNAGPDANSFAWATTWVIGLFALLATVIALGLSQIEAAADKRTLAAIGAPKSFRSRMVAIQAFSLTSVGALLGGFVGLAVGVTLVVSSNVSEFTLPWPQLVTLFVGIPVLAAAIFWVFTPRKLAYEARQPLD